MTFPDIFDNFKNHSYIRRESWNKDVFIQLRHTAQLIRMVVFEVGKTPQLLNNDCRISAEDLLAEDWIDIEDLMPKDKVKPTTFWGYVETLKDGTDEWRKAIDLGGKYHRQGKDPDKYLDEIIKKVENK